MRPNQDCLFEVADSQRGYFTASQARICGYSWALLSHHVTSGRLMRARRGLYRLRQYPASPREEVLAAWLAAGSGAVVSHDSALDILGLADVIPDAIHLTVPRSRRSWQAPPNVAMHTTQAAIGPGDMVERDGIRVTSPARTILDAAEAGTAPDQVALAIRQAVDRGLVTRDQLIEGARGRGQRIERLVAGALAAQPA
jgi:predicted transcriptional regulator of viral defense system